MSGIVGIFERDGAPVDRALLQASVATMEFRGPDENDLWCEGSVGLGHTMLRTTPEALADHQPATFADRFWITADVRLDSRRELIASLNDQGCRIALGAPDSELLLNAYAIWGEDCVAHLQGDFAFAIWDASRHKLFCARDHFGIRPFYFANVASTFVFSNTLNTVRFHPAVSDELNDHTVADFLLFGLNCNNSTTIFQNIQRLPPAHSLEVSREGVQQKRYWTPPIDGRLRYPRAADYIEQFSSLWRDAVSDRSHTPTTGILLSGGLDSGAVAAALKALSQQPGHSSDIHTYTFVHPSLPRDQESHFAQLTADFLSFPNRTLQSDLDELFKPPSDPAMILPEPLDNPFSTGLFEDFQAISADCRVVFSGEGGDNLMNFQFVPHLRDLFRTRQWSRLLQDTLHYLWIRPFPWRGLRYRFQKFAGHDSLIPDFPDWLNPDFVERLHLKERWMEGNQLPLPAEPHPIHPRGHASMFLPQWTCMFETENAGATRAPVEVVYPFLDLRLVNFLLALPPFPWFFEKALTRRAMAGQLPAEVLNRKKTPLQGDPLLQVLHQNQGDWPNLPPWTAQMDSYISHSKLVTRHATITAEQASLHARPHCFNFWLQSSSRVQYK